MTFSVHFNCVLRTVVFLPQNAVDGGAYEEMGIIVADVRLLIPNALTGGEIAGIVIGSFFGAFIILVLAVLLVW